MSKNGSISFPVSLERGTDLYNPVRINLTKAANGVKMKPIVIPKGENKALVTIEVSEVKSKVPTNANFQGIARIGKGKTNITSLPLPRHLK